MATKKEKYESMRIMSLEGSVLYKNEGFTALKNGKPNPGAFRGVLDESLDTLKLAEIYERHEDEIGYPYLEGDHNYCRAIVNVSFERAVKVFESCGNRYVRNGYTVIDADMEEYVLGTDEITYTDSAYSAPMMTSVAYQCVVLRVPDGTDVPKAKQTLLDNANPAKWICVEAESVAVESIGDVILYVMGFDEDVSAIKDAFLALDE